MKICFIMESLKSGGAERMAVRLANALIKDNWEVTFLMFDNTIFYELNPGIKVIITEEAPGSSIRRFLTRRKECKGIIEKLKPEVVLGLLFWPIIYIIPHKKDYRLICSERSNPLYKISAKKKIAKKLVYKNSDVVIFQTIDAMIEYPAAIRKKGVVIPNFVDDKIFDIKYDFQNRENVICAVGSLKPEKDYKTLLDAIKKVSGKYHDYILKIYGDDYQNGELREYADGNGINNVAFHEADNSVWKKVRTSCCYVLSSVSEGMPNALMEAMAIGIPCVSTDCNFGPRSLIENNWNGQIVSVGDSDAMAEAIIRYIEDESFSKAISENAVSSMQKYRSNIMFDKYKQCLTGYKYKEFEGEN